VVSQADPKGLNLNVPMSDAFKKVIANPTGQRRPGGVLIAVRNRQSDVSDQATPRRSF
jgi:hypothetical protein